VTRRCEQVSRDVVYQKLFKAADFSRSSSKIKWCFFETHVELNLLTHHHYTLLNCTVINYTVVNMTLNEQKRQRIQPEYKIYLFAERNSTDMTNRFLSVQNFNFIAVYKVVFSELTLRQGARGPWFSRFCTSAEFLLVGLIRQNTVSSVHSVSTCASVCSVCCLSTTVVHTAGQGWFG